MEPTNEPYAIAKIAGIKLCEAYRDQHGANFISAMPTNLYGPGDNYDLQNSHVVPALLRKFHEAKVNGDPTVTCWGTGSPRAASFSMSMTSQKPASFSCVSTMTSPSSMWAREPIYPSRNSPKPSGTSWVSKGELVWDTDKPDGTPRKLMNCDRIHALGWTHRISLADGLRSVYEEYRNNPDAARTK